MAIVRGRMAERTRGQGESADAPAGVKLSLLAAMIDLWRLIMRSKAPGLKWRTAVALALIVAGKVLGIWAPFLLGHAVNSLAHGKSAPVFLVW